MNLYLKYRPSTIDELDLTGVRETLKKAVSGSNMAHAYLFTGPRGAGKTSAARILAKVVNCEKNKDKLGEPCNKCDACKSIIEGRAVDVVEVDAASNRGIDDVRELKEKIRLSPAVLPKKVYIIDEVHMMTTEAFNALLKTLEEPPEHSLFILCTTEAHKVPETISSRCSRVLFTKATPEEMQRSFSRVIAGEEAEVDEEAIELLSKAVDGSFRDGVKILDQVLSVGKKVGIKEIEQALYGASGYTGVALSSSLSEKDANKSLELFHKAVSEGVDLTYLLVDLMRNLRDRLVGGDVELSALIMSLDEVASRLSLSPVPEILVEIVIIEWCKDSANPSASSGQAQKTGGPEKSENSEQKKQTTVKRSSRPKPEVSDHPKSRSSDTPISRLAENKYSGEEIWDKMMSSLNGDSYSMGALLSKARPGVIVGNRLTIEVKYSFHRDQIMAEKFRSRIEEHVSRVMGSPVIITCVVNPDMNSLKPRAKVDTIAQETNEADAGDELADAALEIFTN